MAKKKSGSGSYRWTRKVYGRAVDQIEEIDATNPSLETWLRAALVVPEGEPDPVPNDEPKEETRDGDSG